ncbi:putative nucleic acid-binding protein [Thermococcus stetteri]|nr:putative nucleic acid-binding protein [Thermococcus stetteri]
MKLFIDTNLFVYLNANINEEVAERLDAFYTRLVKDNEVYTNVLVLDELIHFSKKKYGVSYPETIAFIEDIVLLSVRVLSINLPNCQRTYPQVRPPSL